MMLSKKISMALLLVAAVLAPPTRSCRLTRDEDDPLSSYFLDDPLSSMRCLQYQKRGFGRRELRGDKINYNVGPRNLEPALEQQDDLVRTVKLTYHPGEEFGDENTYTAEVTIGKANFNLKPSTGSSDVWVTWGTALYPQCKRKRTYTIASDAEMGRHAAEDAMKLGSFRPQHGVEGLFQNFVWLERSRETARRADNVKVGGITVKGYTFGVLQLSHATPYFCRQPYDGVLGLAFRALNAGYSDPSWDISLEPFLADALEQKNSGFKSGIFAFYLTKDGNSELHIGGTGDSSLFEGKDIEYHNVLEPETPSHWMIGNGRIEADGETIVSDKSTIINSGTDMIVGPEDDVVKIYEKIRGAHTTTPGGFYIFPCDEKIPEITFSWGEKGKKWTMDRESFILSRDKTSHKTKPVCRGAIQSFRLALSESEKFRQSLTIEESDSKTWVFGTSFMRMLYPIFNMKEMQIGFARRKQGGKRPHPESPSEGSHLAHEQKKLKPRND